MIKMPKEIAIKWLKALRSGQYKQGYSALVQQEDDDGIKGPFYCCLGVLQMEVSGKCEDLALPSDQWLKAHKIDFGVHPTRGYPTNNPFVDTPAYETPKELAAINDESINFLQIADIIEANLEYTDA